MRLYAITDRNLFGGDERARCAQLLNQAARWIAAGVQIIQLREKALPPQALEDLVAQMVKVAKRAPIRTRILINAAVAQPEHAAQVEEIAIRTGADGLHLPGPILPVTALALARIRSQWPSTREPPLLSVACHTAEEAAQASAAQASLILFAPVFQKPVDGGSLPGAGLKALQTACAAAGAVPVYALGGVTAENASACIAAGAAGVAAIRLFACCNDWTTLVGPGSDLSSFRDQESETG